MKNADVYVPYAWFHWKNGGHLDARNITLCAGSRWSVGSVPSAGWYGHHKFCVCRYGFGHRSDYVRAREAVSL